MTIPMGSGFEKKPDDPLTTAQPPAVAGRLVFRRKLRHFYDQAAHVGIAIGGVSVIVAILLIFLYLLYEVIPLFASADVEKVNEFTLMTDGSADVLHIAIEEQSEIAVRLTGDGQANFFALDTGLSVANMELPIPANDSIISFSLDSEENGIFGLGLASGQVLIAQYDYETSYAREDNRRIITPVITYPFGTEPYPVFADQQITALAVRSAGQTMIMAALADDGSAGLLRLSRQTNLMSAFTPGGGGSFTREAVPIEVNTAETEQLFIDYDQRWLYLVGANGLMRLLDLRAAFNGDSSAYVNETFLVESGASLSKVSFLLGGVSLIVADSEGNINQWFLTGSGAETQLERVRNFMPGESGIVALTPEQRRKNFVAVDAVGSFSIYNTTARREVFKRQLLEAAPTSIAISPRGNTLLAELEDGHIVVWNVHNEHPEVSMSVLWSKVWYENYDEPEYVWQSSSATSEFEPKYSLVPLSFGTLKAAFYAMLLAAPLAICGAIYTGYFMAPAMRRKVKPLIELMEALPTVVLGFLAGLWLAPFVERNLLGTFSIMVLLPVGILLASFGWSQLPRSIRHRVPDGWEAALLVPVILLFGVLAFVLSTPIENLFFAGDLRFWISSELGINYDQRNAMVVGFAMGFAVIPTIFSIAEDAIFTVPRHLTYGSLALGATPWQSLHRVVLPTASPGIFSGLMIGFGRAVGETMIVLMATGNTPIMDINIFEGMRTLAANIAVEIPESEVDSTHYRILFLAALVLFLFTFVFNTIAEVVRQRLRSKYSTI